MFAGKKSAQIREILISESAWEEMTCLFAPSLAGWRVSETIFIVLASAMWLLVFKYVFIKVGAKTKRPVADVSNLYLVLAGVCCIVNPIACLMSIVLYPLWVMNKALKFASVKFSNDNG